MATDRTPDKLRAFLVPYSRIGQATYSAASVVTQAGPHPGVPEFSTQSDLVLSASGARYTPGESIEMRAQAAGGVGPDGGTHVWRHATDAADKYRGWEPPLAISQWEALEYSTVAGRWQAPKAVTLQDNSVLCAAVKSNRYIKVWRRDPQTDVQTEYAVADHGSTYTFGGFPCLCELPSGRVLCFFFVEQGTEAQVRMYFSDDHGQTWAMGQRTCLAAAISTAATPPQRLCCAYLVGGVSLIAWVTVAAGVFEDVLMQWASQDLGATFSLLDQWTGATLTTHGAYPDLCVHDGVLTLGYLRESGPATHFGVPYLRTVGSAFSLFSAVDEVLAVVPTNTMHWGSKPTQAFVAGDYALWADTDGTMYQVGRDFNSAGGAMRECYVHRSGDGGITWLDMGGGSAPGDGAAWWQGQDLSTGPRAFSATSQGGRQLIYHLFDADPGTGDPSLCCAYLGGYTSVILPPETGISPGFDRAGWERTYLPFDLPENTGAATWTSVVAGAPVVTLDPASARLKIVCGVGDSQEWTTTTTPPGTVPEGILVLMELRVLAGVGQDGQCLVRIGDLIAAYEVLVTVSSTAITLIDTTTAAVIGTVLTPAAVDGLGVQVLIGLYGPAAPADTGVVVAHWRAAGTGTDRLWSVVGASSTVHFGAAGVSRVRWGNLGTATNYWAFVGYSSGPYTRSQLPGQQNPHALLGRAYSARPDWIDDGVMVAASDGPAYRGDTCTIGTRYDFGIENIDPVVSPSPDHGWRSTSDAANCVIQWDLEATEAGGMLGSAIAVYLGAINFRDYELWGQTSAGAWVQLCSGNAAYGQQNLSYVRNADMVQPDETVATSAVDYYRYGVLRDSHVKLYSAGSPGTIYVRKIANNSEGAWSGNALTKRVRIQLAAYDAADSTGGILGEIWSRNSLVVKPGVGEYRSYKLIIPAQQTCEGYFEIGVCVIGHLAVLGAPYDWGRSRGWAPNYSLATGRSGTRRGRQLGSTRRRVEVAWTGGVDEVQLYGAPPQPDYVTAWSGGPPVAACADTPYLMAGIVEQLAGAVGLVVYIPRIDVGANADINIPAIDGHIYGRVTSADVVLDSALGSERQDELIRVAKVTLEEEL